MKKPTKHEPIVFETFFDFGSYEQGRLTQTEPSSFNGMVRVRRRRITVEIIEEPNEVIAERLQKLWDECDNHHEWPPIRFVAKSIGYELRGSAGSKRKKGK